MNLVYARGVVKNRLDGKLYLVIVSKYLFNPNSDKTLLEEYQIECFGVNVYSRPRVFGGKHFIDAIYRVGRFVKLGIYWYVSTIYIDVQPPHGGVS